MLPTRYQLRWNHAIEPLARVLIRCGFTPTMLTVGGLLLVIASCAWLLLTGHILVFCVLVTLASLVDTLDGAVARRSGRVTKTGAYLDAVCDRYAEAVAVISVAAVTGYWLLSMLVLTGALLVSYAKARAAMEAPVSNREWPDLMERTERDIVYVVGLAASQLLGWRPLGQDLFWWTLVILSVFIHLTVLQRARRAIGLIRLRGEG